MSDYEEYADAEAPATERRKKLDVRMFGRPDEFHGKKEKWSHFEFVFVNWFVCTYEEAETMLIQAAASVTPIPEVMGAPSTKSSRALFLSLSQLCKGAALDIVKSVGSRNGYETWRRLSAEYDPNRCQGNSLGMLQRLLKFDFGSTKQFHGLWIKWENEVEVFMRISGETAFTDNLKIALVMAQAPQEIRTHLKVQRYTDYSSFRNVLMQYLHSGDLNEDAMDVGAMYGKGKKGKHGDKGKGKGDKGGKDKGRGKVKGKTKNKGAKFEGTCDKCGKFGHRWRDCYVKVAAVEDGAEGTWDYWPETPSSTTQQQQQTPPAPLQGPPAPVRAVTYATHEQEEPCGWFFAVSFAVPENEDGVIAGIVDGWQEIVLDSGSVSTACPFMFGEVDRSTAVDE